MATTHLHAWNDDHGNAIEFDGPTNTKVDVIFSGTGNRLILASGGRLGPSKLQFEGNNGTIRIGTNRGVNTLKASIRVGEDCEVVIGNNVSATSTCMITTAEGGSIRIGDDVMISTSVRIRADDAHPIFDVRTGLRVNTVEPIAIGNHVWLSHAVTVLSGTSIGDGTVIGTGAIVTSAIPNNCIAAGVPARVLRRDIAWERPHLTQKAPPYKLDASTVEKSPYWNLTEDE